MTRDTSHTVRTAHAVAAAIYLAVALWSLRAILPAPATTLPYAAVLDRYETPLVEQNEYKSADLEKEDQQFHVAIVTHHARELLAHPSKLFDPGHCHPFPDALTLGEHMFGASLLAVVPHALSGSPILSFNAVSALALWIAALGMYALVFHWTRSTSAAFVAGLLFAFHPDHIFRPGHPFVHGNHWTPLALLFLARLFERRRWLDAAGLALFVGLQILESPYQLLAFAMIAGVYLAYLASRNLRHWHALAPKLIAVAGASVAVLVTVYGPYLRTRSMWPGLLRGQDTEYPLALHDPADFLIGGGAYTGSVALLLAAIALLDRMRGPRRGRGHDPRLAYSTAGLLIAWSVVWAVPVPFTDLSLPSPLLMMRDVVPGVAALRVPVLARLGVHLVVAFLAGYGMLAILERRSAGVRYAVTAAISLLALGEVFYSPVAEYTFRYPVDMATYSPAPSREDQVLYDRMSPGAVLDLPAGIRLGSAFAFPQSAHYTLQQAYHRMPSAACFGSFPSPLRAQVAALASRLPDPGASDALAALGFGTIIVHREVMRPAAQRRFEEAAASDAQGGERLERLGSTSHLIAYRLTSPARISNRFDLLVAGELAAPVLTASPPENLILFTFENRGRETFRHPDPLEPSDLVVRWVSESGDLVDEQPIRGMLPLALGAGMSIRSEIAVPVPPHAGLYQVTLARAAEPSVILARQSVQVEPTRSRKR